IAQGLPQCSDEEAECAREDDRHDREPAEPTAEQQVEDVVVDQALARDDADTPCRTRTERHGGGDHEAMEPGPACAEHAHEIRRKSAIGSKIPEIDHSVPRTRNCHHQANVKRGFVSWLTRCLIVTMTILDANMTTRSCSARRTTRSRTRA